MLTGKGPDTRNWLSRAPVSSSLLLAFSLSSGANGKECTGSSESRNIRSSRDHCPRCARTGSSQRSPQVMKYSLPIVALGLLGGCVTAPPPSLTADNPASPSASEAARKPLHNPLAADDLTTKTRELLAQAGKSQDQPSSTPVPEQQQMDQMPGMKVP
jgi:hypothetical protein